MNFTLPQAQIYWMNTSDSLFLVDSCYAPSPSEKRAL